MRVLLAFVAGFAVALGIGWASQPHCPTEDSCKPDYQSTWHGNIWTGKEQVP